jgi:iron-sulfur cluster repair protein YtfE (RIC family)
MKRSPALYSLSHDHHQGLILAQILKKGAPEYKGLPKTFEGKLAYLLTFYEQELITHFSEEEEILHPAVKGKNAELDELFGQIFSEHQQIHSLIRKIKEKPDEEKLDEFGRLLESHIRKEERELFQLIQESMSDEELESLEQKLKRSDH